MDRAVAQGGAGGEAVEGGVGKGGDSGDINRMMNVIKVGYLQFLIIVWILST